MSVQAVSAREHLCLEDFCELGQRLSETDLHRMGLLQAVRDAELEAHWRLRASLHLLAGFAGKIAKDLETLARAAENQMNHPTRGTAQLLGKRPHTYGRSLPSPGTLLIRQHEYRDVCTDDEVFRFVVVNDPAQLIRLGDNNNYVYANPSIAARMATGNMSENGWRFFGTR